MMRSGIAREILFVLVLVIVPACIYLNSLDGEFVFDASRIYNSPAVKLERLSLIGLADAVRQVEPTTRPVANLSFVLNYYINRHDVRGYHLVNLLVHVLTGVFFFGFLRTTLALPALKGRYRHPEWIAFAAALLWLVHPLQTQAVSYIIQRMTSLAALFFILALLLYSKGRQAASFDRRFWLFAGAVLAWLLAMGSKETAVTLPLFILLYEWFFFRDLDKGWLLKRKYLLLGIVIVVAGVPFIILGDNLFSVIMKGYAGRDFSMYERVLTQFRVLLFYLGLIVLPLPGRLSLEHEIAVSTSLISPLTTILSILAAVGIIAAAVRMAPRHRLPAFCILWFFGNHAVEGSILPLELIFEHRNYLPSMMVVCLAVIAAMQWVKSKKLLMPGLVVMVALLSFWTYQRNFVWQDRVSLWSDSVSKAPGSARAHNNLAVALKSRGMFQEAIFHYRETIRLDPDFVEAYYNLGNVMMLTGNPEMAVGYYEQAVNRNPGMVVLNMSLANALFDSNRFSEASFYYRKVLQLDPGNVNARMDLERASRMLEAMKLRGGEQPVPAVKTNGGG